MVLPGGIGAASGSAAVAAARRSAAASAKVAAAKATAAKKAAVKSAVGKSGKVSYSRHHATTVLGGAGGGASGAKTGIGTGGDSSFAFNLLITTFYLANMAEMLEAASGAAKLFLEFSGVTIDNFTFKLFYRATTTLLVVSSVLATSKQVFGDPISCGVHMGSGIKDDVLNSFCWMYSTFNLPPSYRGSCARQQKDSTVLYNTYYQWVPLFLGVSAISFCLPRLIWLMSEGGLMKFLVRGATGKLVDKPKEKKELLIDAFKNHLHNKYDRYALTYFACEQLNTIVLIFMWLMANRFLLGQFHMYGANVLYYFQTPPYERTRLLSNPMCEVFPRIASCNFIRYGTAGRQENQNAICVLSLNMINDKIFLVLWWWYAFLAFAMTTRIVYRVGQISFTTFRFHTFNRKLHKYLGSKDRVKFVERFIRRCSIGDWFVLYQMSRNMNKRFFVEFLLDLIESQSIIPRVTIDEVEDQDLEPDNDVDFDRLSIHSRASKASTVVDLSCCLDDE